MENKIKQRYSWIKLYKKLGNAGKICAHHSISRFTLRKWIKRYEEFGLEGLIDLSRRPKTFPKQKRNKINEQLVLKIKSRKKVRSQKAAK